MKSTDKIERLIKNSRYKATTEAYNKTLDSFMQSVDDYKKQKPAMAKPNIGRIIMNSAITKSAAAAILVVAIFIGVNLFDGIPAYGMSEVVEKLRNARIIYICTSIYLTKNEAIEKIENNIEHDEEYVLEKWIDIERGRTRTSGLGRDMMVDQKSGASKTMISKIDSVFDGEHKMQISHRWKSVRFDKLSNFQKLLHTRKTLERFLDEIHMSPNELSEYINIGQKHIDNELLDIWERFFHFIKISIYSYNYTLFSKIKN